MPVSLLNTDTSFPTFTEGQSVNEKIEVITDYLYMLLEELRYTFGNLGEENFNDKGLDELSIKITKPVYGKIEDTAKGLTHQFKITAEGLNSLAQLVTDDAEALAQFKTFVSDQYATIQSITSLKSEITESVNGSVNTTISEALTEFKQTADEEYATIASLAQFKNEVKEEVNGSVNTTISEALTEFKQTADEEYATIASLAQFKNEVKEEVNGSVNTTISEALTEFKQTADEEYASASVFASYKEEINGSIESFENSVNEAMDEFEESVNGTVTSITETVASFTANADNKYASASVLAEYKNEVSTKYATKNALSNLETTLNQSFASFTATAESTYAKTTQIASVTNSSGKVTAASIVAAVNSSGSSVKISADKIEFEGEAQFLTAADVGNNGTTIIAGDRISIDMNGANDYSGYDVDSDNGLNFTYTTESGYVRNFANIYTRVSGEDTAETSRYALHISTHKFRNNNGSSVYAGLKLDAAGRISIEAQYGIYISTRTSGQYGSITIDADDVTCIRAWTSYDDVVSSGASYGYVFCTDGIYYDGVKIVST